MAKMKNQWVTVEAEVCIDEFNWDVLVDSLADRVMKCKPEGKAAIIKYINEEINGAAIRIPSALSIQNLIKTLPDEMKAEFLIQNWDKITLEQLENLI